MASGKKSPKRLTIVIKLGTSSIVDETTRQPLLSVLSTIVETAIKLLKDGHRVIIVSSGAIGVGLRRMDMEKKPRHLPKVQALAAIGQCRLMSLWDSLFTQMGQPVAQILLTRNDIADRTQYVNAQNTLAELLEMGVIPIVNENDTVAVSEIRFGDNDTLSAITAAMVNANYLFLMTDVDCLYDKNPRTDPSANPLPVVANIDNLEADVSSSGSSLGTGGMSTKIVAARLATSAGVTTIITRSSRPGNISEIVRYTESLTHIPIEHIDGTSTIPNDSTPPFPLHTRFIPSAKPIQSRSFWLLHSLVPHGTIYIDSGALGALTNGASLLPAGVLGLEGSFSQQESVRLFCIADPEHSSHSKTLSLDGDFYYHSLGVDRSRGEEVGRALVNYGSVELAKIRRCRSSQIRHVLGYSHSDYVCLRENIVLLNQEKTGGPETAGLEAAQGGRSHVEAGVGDNTDTAGSLERMNIADGMESEND